MKFKSCTKSILHAIDPVIVLQFHSWTKLDIQSLILINFQNMEANLKHSLRRNHQTVLTLDVNMWLWILYHDWGWILHIPSVRTSPQSCSVCYLLLLRTCHLDCWSRDTCRFHNVIPRNVKSKANQFCKITLMWSCVRVFLLSDGESKCTFFFDVCSCLMEIVPKKTTVSIFVWWCFHVCLLLVAIYRP